MKNNSQKGFTLIEMLVVIGMIGVLAATVLTALAPSRAKARDARIISGLNQLSAIVEASFDGNFYPASLPSTAAVTTVVADITTIATVAPTYNISATKIAFAISSPLASDATQYYCVDSTGYRGSSIKKATSGVCQ